MSFKNVVLGIGIVVVFALALGYGIEAFYPSPKWDNYCGNVSVPQTLVAVTPAQCGGFGGTWKAYNGDMPKIENSSNGYCDYYSGCQKGYDFESEDYSKRVFVLCLIIGLIALAVGYWIFKVEPVGSALMGAGVWSFIYGGVINWRNFSDYWRFALLFAVLIILIWFAIKVNSSKKKGWMFWK